MEAADGPCHRVPAPAGPVRRSVPILRGSNGPADRSHRRQDVPTMHRLAPQRRRIGADLQAPRSSLYAAEAASPTSTDTDSSGPGSVIEPSLSQRSARPALVGRRARPTGWTGSVEVLRREAELEMDCPRGIDRIKGEQRKVLRVPPEVVDAGHGVGGTQESGADEDRGSDKGSLHVQAPFSTVVAGHARLALAGRRIPTSRWRSSAATSLQLAGTDDHPLSQSSLGRSVHSLARQGGKFSVGSRWRIGHGVW